MNKLDRLRELERKATKGEWIQETVKTSIGCCHKVGKFPDRTGRNISKYACIYDDGNDVAHPDEELMANAELITELRNACPALLDALEMAIEGLNETANMPLKATRIKEFREKAKSTLAKIEKVLGEQGKEEG